MLILWDENIKRAAWNGTRIILRQVSPESSEIFDLIMALYQISGNGDWETLASRANVSMTELKIFLEYAAMFLGNIGNYDVSFLNLSFHLFYCLSYRLFYQLPYYLLYYLSYHLF